ncbi:MAG: hypothetical protein HY858_14520 [Candidatus Solibacter usitatus]|nr:hypothetical protein [Candidatus Solibacter usitatus]
MPNYVTPLALGLAPLINVLVTTVWRPPKNAPHPLLYVGYVRASLGAGMVLYFKPA